MNDEQEPTGPISFFTIDQIGPLWFSDAFTFTVGPDTAQVYLSIECKNGDGDYILSFRNFQISNSTGGLMLLLYGTEGDPFSWQVGSGEFAFKQFAPA